MFTLGGAYRLGKIGLVGNVLQLGRLQTILEPYRLGKIGLVGNSTGICARKILPE